MINTLKILPENKEKLLPYYQLARNVAIVAGCFSTVVMIVLAISFYQFRHYDPINSPNLPKLIEQIHQGDSRTELIESARAYDLLIRKAHFTTLAFQRFGAYLLLVGLSLFLIAFKFAFELRRQLPPASKYDAPQDNARQRMVMQWSILGLAITLVLLSFILPNLLSAPWLIPKQASADAKQLPAIDQQTLKDNWIGFRGYRGLGLVNNQVPPTNWNVSNNTNILWKTELTTPGFNSPICWNDYVFLSGADESGRFVYCYSLSNGNLLWQQSPTSKLASLPKVTDDTGWAAPTLTTNGHYVAALFATGELFTIDFTGKIIWEKKLPTPDNHYGHSSSLIVYQDLLLVQYDHNKRASLIAYDMNSGKKKWEKKRSVDISWASPIIAPTSQGDQLILLSTPLIIAYQPLTGKELWQLEDVVDGEIGPSPAFYNDKLFVINQYSTLAAIDPLEPKVLWTYKQNLSDIPSPVVAQDLLIVPTSFGMVSCFSASTGELFWKHRFENGFNASAIIANNHVYLLDQKGIMHIIKLSNAFSLVASLDLKEKTAATPAFIDNKIIIRGESHLYCIGSNQP